MASVPARSRECTEKFSPSRSQSGTFDLKEMARCEEKTVQPLIKIDREECEVNARVIRCFWGCCDAVETHPNVV